VSRPKYQAFFKSDDNYWSYLHVTAAAEQAPTPGNEGPPKKNRIETSIGAKIMERAVFHKVQDTRSIPQEARDALGLQDQAPTEIYRVILRTTPHLAATRGLYNYARYTNELVAWEVKVIQETFRRTDETTIHPYLKGTRSIEDNYEKLRIRIKEDLTMDQLSKWHVNHPGQMFVQYRALPSRDNRLEEEMPLKDIFWEWGEYATFLGFGAAQEQESVQARQEELGSTRHLVQFMRIPHAQDRKYFVFMELQDYYGRLHPGDAVTIGINTTLGDAWPARIVTSLLVAPVGTVTAIVNRPRRQNEDTGECAYDLTEIQAGDCDYTSNDAAQRSIEALPQVPVTIELVTSSRTTRVQLYALQHLPLCPKSSRADVYRELVLGQDITARTTEDINHGIDSALVQHMRAHMTITPSQSLAIDYLRAIPNGLGIITGPPGTGKTHLVAQAIIPLIAANERRQILLLAPANEPEDDMARTTYKTARRAGFDRTIVIRLHSMELESNILYARAKAMSTQPQEEEDEDVPPVGDPLAELEVAQYVRDFYNTATARQHGVQDARVRDIELSLAVWTLKVAGVLPGLPGLEHKNASTFRDLFERYTAGELEADRYDALQQSFLEMRVHMLSIAHVVATTCTNSATRAIHQCFGPDLVVIDEAGKATELDVVVPKYHYDPRCLVLVGDENQLAPVATSMDDERYPNNLARHLAVPMMERFKKIGYPAALLREQHRIVAGLATLPSQLFSQGKLQDNQPATCLEARPSARAFSQALHQCLDVPLHPVPRLLVDLQGVTCESQNTSMINKETAGFVLNAIERLLRAGIKAEDITIITFYDAQHALYNAAIQRYHQEQPDSRVGTIKVGTVDSFQGREAPYVFLDFVISRKLGFVREKKRLTVALTRERDGLVLVGAARAMNLGYGDIYNENQILTYISDDFKRAGQCLTLPYKQMKIETRN
jgi:hypothetical protein